VSSFLFSGGFVFLANLLAAVALWLNGSMASSMAKWFFDADIR